MFSPTSGPLDVASPWSHSSLLVHEWSSWYQAIKHKRVLCICLSACNMHSFAEDWSLHTFLFKIRGRTICMPVWLALDSLTTKCKGWVLQPFGFCYFFPTLLFNILSQSVQLVGLLLGCFTPNRQQYLSYLSIRLFPHLLSEQTRKNLKDEDDVIPKLDQCSCSDESESMTTINHPTNFKGQGSDNPCKIKRAQ